MRPKVVSNTIAAGEGAFSGGNPRNKSFNIEHGGGNYETTYTSQHNTKQQEKINNDEIKK